MLFLRTKERAFCQGKKTLLDRRRGQEESVNIFWLAETLCENMHFTARILPHLGAHCVQAHGLTALPGPQTLEVQSHAGSNSEQGLPSSSPAGDHTVHSGCRRESVSVQLW